MREKGLDRLGPSYWEVEGRVWWKTFPESVLSSGLNAAVDEKRTPTSVTRKAKFESWSGT